MSGQTWRPPDLAGKIAVVTGASRGIGRGIAVVLGECGATVYVTGRSSRVSAAVDRMGGTIEETAEEVTRRGRAATAVRCDATDLDQVEDLFARVRSDYGGFDILVCNAWGGYEGHPRGLPIAHFWETPFELLWHGMIVSGLRPAMACVHFGVPLMIKRPGGLIVCTIAWDHNRYLGGFYDISKHAIVRFVWGISRELKQAATSVAVAPGFCRTERVLAAFQTDERRWREIPFLAQSESPEYTGRAIASLAGDPKRIEKSGKAFRTGELADEYGFTDVDGRRVPPFRVEQSFENMLREE